MTEADGKPRASTGHARAITGAPPVEHPPARGTMPCAPGAFSLTAPVFRSPRAQKGAWCARHRRQEQARVQAMGAGGGQRCRKAQAGTGKRGRQAQDGASGDKQEGTTVRDEVWTNQKRGRLSISRPRIKDVEVFRSCLKFIPDFINASPNFS